MQAWIFRLTMAVLLLAAPPVSAATRLAITTLESAALRLDGIEATLDYAAAAEAPGLRLRIARTTLAGLSLERLDWRCRWEIAPVLRCAGTLRVGGRAAGELALRVDASMQLRWEHAERRLAVDYDRDAAAFTAALEEVPLNWLQPLLSAAMADLAITAGTVGGKVARAADAPLSAALTIKEFGVDSPAGDVAAAGIMAQLQLDLAANEGAPVTLVATLDAGEILLGPVYAELAAGSRLDMALATGPTNRGLVGPLRWSDPEGFSAAFALAPEDRWNVVLSAPDLARSAPRYLSGALAAAGLADAELAGAIDAEFTAGNGGLHALSIRAQELSLVQAAKGLRASGVSGELHWDAAAAVQDSEAVWKTLAVYGVELGPSRLALRGEGGQLHLRAPLQLAPLQGRLQINEGWVDPRQREAELVGQVSELSLESLSQRAGWPPFSGRIGGQLPRARYRDQRLVVDGSLLIDVFGGRVDIGGLVLERPLGVAPTLTADVRLDDLDLTPLTAAFGFGEISGRLDGSIAGLRLVDWSPVAFDAVLHTDPDYRGPRRISQRAVQDIGRVGGGLAGGLQNQLLAVFDSFGYRRIGMRCRLDNNVCTMGGVEDSGTGYVLIEGAGLPRVTVNGFQRRVDWPVLLARLQAATEGGIKID